MSKPDECGIVMIRSESK